MDNGGYMSGSAFYRKLEIAVCVFSVLVLTVGDLHAARQGQAKKVVRKDVIAEAATPKAVTGTISYVDGKYISIVYSTDPVTGAEYEIGFWVDEATQATSIWKKNLSTLRSGDTVDISYEEVTEEYDAVLEDGTKERKTRVKEMKPKGLTFRSPAKSR